MSKVIHQPHDSNSQAFLELVQTQLSSETGENVMTIAQQFEAKGEARGEARGEAKAKKIIAQKLLRQLSVEEVAQITGLEIKEITALKNDSAH